MRPDQTTKVAIWFGAGLIRSAPGVERCQADSGVLLDRFRLVAQATWRHPGTQKRQRRSSSPRRCSDNARVASPMPGCAASAVLRSWVCVDGAELRSESKRTRQLKVLRQVDPLPAQSLSGAGDHSAGSRIRTISRRLPDIFDLMPGTAAPTQWVAGSAHRRPFDAMDA